jgi:hypothetical protein
LENNSLIIQFTEIKDWTLSNSTLLGGKRSSLFVCLPDQPVTTAFLLLKLQQARNPTPCSAVAMNFSVSMALLNTFNTVDGCEILHQVVDGQNPFTIPLFAVFHSYQ